MGANMLKHIMSLAVNALPVARRIPKDPIDFREILVGEKEIGICYRDLDGLATQRMVEPRAIAVWGNTACLEAFCHLRRAQTSFRLDRIEAVVLSRRRIRAPIEYIRTLNLPEPILTRAEAACTADEPLAKVA